VKEFAGARLDSLRTRIESAVAENCPEPAQRKAALGVLGRTGFALHKESKCRAGILALEIYHAVRGGLDDVAWLAATAAELYIESGFLFDDVADGDAEPATNSSIAAELALALTLESCAATVACDAAANADGAGLTALRRLMHNITTASAGQHLDAILAGGTAATTDEALRMTELKAGGCGRLVAGFAADLATGDGEVAHLFTEFGADTFIYLQLVDDLRDAYAESGVPHDMINGKNTVPLAYFRSGSTERSPTETGGIMIGTDVQDDQYVGYRQEFAASGAGAFGAVVAEAYLIQARANLAALSERLGSLDPLEQFLESIEFRPQDIPAVR
jgi:geranylgeranyl pyrophosphate synthase